MAGLLTSLVFAGTGANPSTASADGLAEGGPAFDRCRRAFLHRARGILVQLGASRGFCTKAESLPACLLFRSQQYVRSFQYHRQREEEHRHKEIGKSVKCRLSECGAGHDEAYQHRHDRR